MQRDGIRAAGGWDFEVIRSTGDKAMKAKVLTWWARNGGSAEQMLNDWLTQNSDINIKNISQSESGDVTANRRITYTIWYD